MHNKSLEKLKKLEKELKELSIKYKYATERDLPFRYKDKRGIGIYITINDIDSYKNHLIYEMNGKQKGIELLKLELEKGNDNDTIEEIDKKSYKPKNFELFERITNGDLRPHKYESDGVLLKEKRDSLRITGEDIAKYREYLDKRGESYTIKIVDVEASETIHEEIRNDEYNELIDIDIPPYPDKKGEIYLEIIEFEYARSLITIDKFIRENEKNKVEEYAIYNMQLLRNIWKDLKHYKKLIIRAKELDYEKSNDFVIWILEVYIERSVANLIDEFEPYLNNEYKVNLIEEIFGEKNRKIKEAIEAIEKIGIKEKKQREKVIGNRNIITAEEDIKKAKNELIKLKDKEEIVTRNEMLEEFNKYILHTDYNKIDEQLGKLKDDKSRYRYLTWIEKKINGIITAIGMSHFHIVNGRVDVDAGFMEADPYIVNYMKEYENEIINNTDSLERIKEKMELQLEYHKEILTDDSLPKVKNQMECLEKKLKFPEKDSTNIVKHEEEKDDVRAVSNQLAAAQNIMIRQRNKIKTLEKGITKNDLEKMINDNKCRFKNGKINYSALAKLLGCSNHTAREKCKFYGVR